MPGEPPTASRARAARPRAGIQRKTREEREQFARQEAERQQARNAETAKSASTRGGVRGGRGGRGARGGATAAAGAGDGRARDPPATGGGVFGAGSGLRSGTRSTVMTGYSEMLEGQVGGKPDPALLKALHADGAKLSGEGGAASGSRSPAARLQDAIDIMSDDERDLPHRDIEQICISSDDDVETLVSGKRKQKTAKREPGEGKGLRPVRAARDKEEEKATAQKKPSRVIKKSDSDVHEVEEDDAMIMDEPVVAKEQPPSSPELRRRNLRKTSNKAKETKTASETTEEKAERLRLAADTDKLRSIFLDRQSEDIVMADEDEDDEDNDDRKPKLDTSKLFLFQLPPLTPFLFDPATDPNPEPQVKQEPGAGGSTSTSNISSIPAAAVTTTDPAAAGSGKTGIKKEPSSSGADPQLASASSASGTRPTLQAEGMLTASEPTRLPGGYVGKLRVHRSGKVSLDWGGTDMEVRYGTEVDFLQDAVLVQTKRAAKAADRTDEGVAKTEEAAAAAAAAPRDADVAGPHDMDVDVDLTSKTYALGQLRRKLVLIPDWAKLYD